MKSDKLFVNGLIYADCRKRPSNFLAVSGSTVIRSGRGKGKEYAGRNTEVIDLKGATVTPGIIDSHIHFLDWALSLDRINLESCSTIADLTTILEERARSASPGEWILGRGWNKSMFSGFPHKRMLDAIFPQHPVVLNSHDEHSLWVNSRALEIAGIDRHTSVDGGYIGKDQDGSPDGIIGENAIPLIRNCIPKPDASLRKNSLLRAQQKLHTLGIVGIHSVDANQAFGDLQDLASADRLRLRVFHSIPLRQLDDAVKMGLRSGLGNDWFQFGQVKIFSDGALGSQSGWMLEPYHETGAMGIQTISEQELTEKIGLALKNGIALAVHAIGDRANRQVLNAFENNADALKIPKARSRIEHAQLLHPDDIPRFSKIGVIASMQPYHAISDHDLAIRYWGERAKFSYAWRSLLESGATLIFGSDAPVEDPHTIEDLQAAVHRTNWSDPVQTIPPAEALYAYTTAPVIASGNQQNRGTLEPGKIADFTIFAGNPLRSAFRDTKIIATAVNGEFVYRELNSL
jgi:Predicted metal-dependent hydrolase with the TIM-barrel fold